MADKSVITNIEARVRQLIDDHKRLSALCAELTAQRDTLTDGLGGGGGNRQNARARVNRIMREVAKASALLGQPLAPPTTQEAE